jgi:hypothetical protein
MTEDRDDSFTICECPEGPLLIEGEPGPLYCDRCCGIVRLPVGEDYRI